MSIEGIEDQDIAPILEVFKRAEEKISKIIEDTDFDKRLEKEKTLAQIKSIIISLEPETKKFIDINSKKESKSGIKEVEEAFDQLKDIEGAFSVIDPRKTAKILDLLKANITGSEKELKSGLTRIFSNIKKQIDLVSTATDKIIQEIALGDILGSSRNKTSNNIIKILRDENIYTKELEENFKRKKILEANFKRNKTNRDKIKAELTKLTDKKEIEKLKEKIKNRKIKAKAINQSISEVGVTGLQYEDKNGGLRNISVQAYVKGYTRSTLAYSRASAVVQRASERGLDLLKISDHRNPSHMCKKWQGKIVCISGDNPDYPSLEEAIFRDYEKGGIFHIFCRHSLTVYILTNIKFEE